MSTEVYESDVMSNPEPESEYTDEFSEERIEELDRRADGAFDDDNEDMLPFDEWLDSLDE